MNALCRSSLARLVCLSLALMGCAPESAEREPPPNFVIIVLDDVSWDDVGAYGNPTIDTPNMDRLANEGMRFDNVFLTTSSCSPSRASILTGLYPHDTGAQALHDHLPADSVIFPTLLAEQAGYYTGAAGKWHLGDAAVAHFDTVIPDAPSDVSGAERWLELLSDRPMDRPFMLWLASRDAHRPYSDATPVRNDPDEVFVPPYLADMPDTRDELARYQDEVSRADDHIGRVREELLWQGVLDDTVIILLSDNGRPFPRAKTMLYDSGVKTPFIIHWPAGVTAGSVNPSLISAIDLAPTVLDLAGVAVPEGFQGVSFVDTLDEPGLEVREHAYVERNWHAHYHFERGMRSLSHLYIRNTFPLRRPCGLGMLIATAAGDDLRALFAAGDLTLAQSTCFEDPRPYEELYDVTADPFSLENLVDDPEHADVLDDFRHRLDLWSLETGDIMDRSRCDEPQQISCADLLKLQQVEEAERQL